MWWRNLFVAICVMGLSLAENESGPNLTLQRRGSRKLFGGYRITPRICKPSITNANLSEGPTICMFNHECLQRSGQVVGACMDGFLFGACCQLPKNVVIGDLLDSELMALPSASYLDNTLSSKTVQTTHRTTPAFIDITSSGVSQITAALLSEDSPSPGSTLQDKYTEIVIEGGSSSSSMFPFQETSKKPLESSNIDLIKGSTLLPTLSGNSVVQINNNGQNTWPIAGVTHSVEADTVVDVEDNEINSSQFKPTKSPSNFSKSTTPRTNSYSESYPAPILQVYTPVPTIQKPMFRPKPPQIDENYVLVPTISHGSLSNKSEEFDPVSYVISQLNHSTTERPISTYSYVSSSFSPYTRKPASTSRKPPSTSYIFSSTIPSRSPTMNDKITSASQHADDRISSVYSSSSTNSFSLITSSKPPSTSYSYSSSFKPTKEPKPPSTSYVYSSSFKPTSTKKPPSTSYIYSSTFRPTTPTKTTPKIPTNKPTAHSTWANSPDAFYSSSSTFQGIYSSTPNYGSISSSNSNRQPPNSVTSSVVGPSFSVSSESSQYSPLPSPAPTLIVLGPVSNDEFGPSRPTEYIPVPTRQQTTSSSRPQASQLPNRKPVNGIKPVNSVVVNNHVVQNIYGNSQRPDYNSPTAQGSGASPYTQSPLTSSTGHQEYPSPTVLITPKPTLSSSYQPLSYEDSEVVTTIDETINFPPDRHPNLNHSAPTFNEDDITTPNFMEDDQTNEKVESFVNQIIYGLQEPFNDLKDIVYSNGTASGTSASTTKKPIKKQGTTTKKPPTKSTTVKTTTRKTVSTRKPTSTTPKRTTTTTRRTVPTKKVQTTTQNLIESIVESQSYRDQCGVRPLMRQAKIVGGKGAIFGEFPWQVLIRESTWLGLFTKNKCGGVLISEKYVMTAAHCQPGFLASLVAVFGEFDISGDLESRKPVSRNVKRVIVHRKYDAATFENDLALLELESPVTFDAHIIPICLPRENEDFTGRMATVTGWGRLKYGGGVPSVLQEVQVPIMENSVCQEMFRTAGHSKVILESFLCAGYANGQKDSCEGDSGGPLVLQRPDGRYQLAGTVSHGIKCAAPYLPGVYMRTAYYKPWITSVTEIQ